jgi:hypothetical protein
MIGAEPAGDVGAILQTWPERVPAVTAARAALETALEAAGVDPGPDAAAAAGKWLAQWGGIGPGTDAASPPRLPGSDADRIETYLLGRLTAHAGGGGAGSPPIILDEALAGLPEWMWDRALAVIQRAAATVQVIYLTSETDEPVQVDIADGPATEVSVDLSDRAVAPRPDAVPVPTGARCTVTCYAPAVDVCERCHQPLCERHAVRVRSSARTLCQSCALVAGGVSLGRRRR